MHQAQYTNIRLYFGIVIMLHPALASNMATNKGTLDDNGYNKYAYNK